jgi:hypothetical protein
LASGLGEPCDGSQASCSAGLMCLASEPDGPSSCHAFCEGQVDCPAPGSLCVPLLGAQGYPIGQARICTPSCNPADGTGCVAGARCAVAQETEAPARWFTVCVAQGDQPHGAACTDPHECLRGMCVDLGGAGQQCLDLCDVAAPSCPTGSSCAGLSEPIQVGGATYGICVPL